MAHHLDVQEHVVAAAEDVGEAEPLGAIEPLHARGERRQAHQLVVRNVAQIGDGCGRDLGGGVDTDDPGGLTPTIRADGIDDDPGALGHRTLAELAQDIAVDQDIRPARIVNEKAKSAVRIEPLDVTGHALRVFRRFFLHPDLPPCMLFGLTASDEPKPKTDQVTCWVRLVYLTPLCHKLCDYLMN